MFSNSKHHDKCYSIPMGMLPTLWIVGKLGCQIIFSLLCNFQESLISLAIMFAAEFL